MQLPTGKKPTVTVTKNDPSASDEFTEKGSKFVTKEKTKTKDIRLVLPSAMVTAIDGARETSLDSVTRTAWIKQAIAEKLKRES